MSKIDMEESDIEGITMDEMMMARSNKSPPKSKGTSDYSVMKEKKLISGTAGRHEESNMFAKRGSMQVLDQADLSYAAPLAHTNFSEPPGFMIEPPMTK